MVNKIKVLISGVNRKITKTFYLENKLGNIDGIISELNSYANLFGQNMPVVVEGNPKTVDSLNHRIRTSPYVSRLLSRPLIKLIPVSKTKSGGVSLNRRKKVGVKHTSRGGKVYSVGIDVGGTFIKCLVLRNSIPVSSSFTKIVTPKKRGDIVLNLAKLVDTAMLGLDKQRLRGIGIGIPGFAENGRIEKLSNLTAWNGLELERSLSKILAQDYGYPLVNVWIDNDANLAGLRNAVRLKKPGSITFTVGTGVGGGIVSNYKIFHGITGAAGEMHLRITGFEGVKDACTCGIKDGCIESVCSSRGIVLSFTDEWFEFVQANSGSKSKSSDDVLSKIAVRVRNTGVITNKDCREIDVAAQKGCVPAKKVMYATAKNFVIAIEYLYKLTGIKDYIFSGGVVQGLLGEYMRKELSFRKLTQCGIKTFIVSDADTAGAEGAALFAWTVNS
ncbi:MAG: ROK family protein [Elusimicrobiota bacterium]